MTEFSISDRSDADSPRVFVTPTERYAGEFSVAAEDILNEPAFELAHRAVRALPGYTATPLIALNDIATKCGVGAVTVKVEGERLPIRSFKLLGPPYSLAVQVARKLAHSDEPDFSLVLEVIRGERANEISQMLAVSATSGNHGRALGWAARQFGCRCRIFMPQTIGNARQEAIEAYGAETVRVPGVFDRSVDRAVEESRELDAMLIGPGATPETGIRRQILHGYSVLSEEWLQAVDLEDGASVPTHVFIPVGGGTFAAAVVARFWMRCGAQRPRMILVQPHTCDSAMRSARHDRREPATGNLETIMDGLSVQQISPDAWQIFRRGVYGYVTIDETVALETLRLFATEEYPEIGETGIAAVAGLVAASRDESIRQRLGLGSTSHVGLVATEGITDEDVYRRLVGEPAEEST